MDTATRRSPHDRGRGGGSGAVGPAGGQEGDTATLIKTLVEVPAKRLGQLGAVYDDGFPMRGVPVDPRRDACSTLTDTYSTLMY